MEVFNLKIVFIGTSGDYSLRHLEALEKKFEVISIICAAPRYYEGREDSFSKRNVLYKNAKKKRIPFYFAKNVSSDRIETVIKKTGCDLICVASCSQLIKKNIIDIPKLGVINAHGAKLPYYKGPNPDYWIFYFQEKEGAVTIHYIDEGEDSGDIINQEIFQIPFGMTRTEYREEILRRSPRLMQQSVLELEKGVAKRKEQQKIKTFRARNLTPEDRQIDFRQWEAAQAYHFLRGTDMLDGQYEKTIWHISIEGYTEETEKCLGMKNSISCRSGGGILQKAVQPQEDGKAYASKTLEKSVFLKAMQRS